MEKRITKKDILEAIVTTIGEDVTVTTSNGVEVTGEDIKAFVNKTIAQLDAKAERAAERAAEKRAAGDELRNAVQAVLTNDYQIAENILEKIANDFPDATKSKIIARLGQLIKAGVAEKEQVKLDDGRKVMGYRINDKAEAIEAEAE